MSNVQAFNPLEIIRQNPAKYYEILFDTGTEILPWTEKGFSEEEDGTMNVQLFSKQNLVKAYNDAFESAKTLAKKGILHIVPISR